MMHERNQKLAELNAVSILSISFKEVLFKSDANSLHAAIHNKFMSDVRIKCPVKNHEIYYLINRCPEDAAYHQFCLQFL